MDIRVFHSLPDDALSLRVAVFVQEQGFVDDPDENDECATHLVMYSDKGEPIATCRVFPQGDVGEFVLGRFCVRKDHRGQCIGRQLLEAAEREATLLGGTAIALHSQLHAKGFYEKCGYVAEGAIEYEQNHPHVYMKKVLRYKTKNPT